MLLYQEVQGMCSNLNNLKKSTKRNTISRFKKEWIKIMALSGLYNKKMETYSINNIELTNYGMKCDIFIVPPLTFDKLKEVRYMIEENLNCTITLNHAKSSVWINSKFIFNLNLKKEFIPVKKDNPYEIYIGNDFSGEPIFADLRKYPHVLITGTTRSGKSKMTDCIITNLITSCNPKDVNLYLCQIAKYDLCLYENLEHTKAFADTLSKTLVVLRYIVEKEIPKRSKIIKPYRQKAILDNIYEYNNLENVKEKIPMIFVIFDEMASLFDKKGDDNLIKKMKEKIEGYIHAIVQYGASLSVYILSSIQRPTHELLPPFVKAMSNTLISLKQSNSKSSEVATDDSKLAVGLPQRQFVYNLDTWDCGIVPLVNNKKIYEFIKPFLNPNHSTLFEDLAEDLQVEDIPKSKVKIKNEYNYDKLNNSIENNVKKIKDYVPYEDNKGKNIVKDSPSLLNTSKPIKKGRIKL